MAPPVAAVVHVEAVLPVARAAGIAEARRYRVAPGPVVSTDFPEVRLVQASTTAACAVPSVEVPVALLVNGA